MRPTAPLLTSLFGPDTELLSSRQQPSTRATSLRLWRSFLTARVLVAVAVALLEGLSHLLIQPVQPVLLGLSASYLALTLVSRTISASRPPPPAATSAWLSTLGVDLLVFALLQWLQQGNLNYTPLLVLPVLMSATLASRLVTLGAASAASLVLLAQSTAWYWQGTGNASSVLLTAAVTSLGYFLLGLLVHELARRLAREELLSSTSRMAIKVQARVNELVIEHLAEGVLVLDEREKVRIINPAARQLLLGNAAAESAHDFALPDAPAWAPLREPVRTTFSQRAEQVADLTLNLPDQAPIRLQVRTRLTKEPAGNLCVVFLNDLRELEARLRTEKLAAMGRMSAAVAHEIRNPLAAISQANALLGEDIEDPAQRRLVDMIDQNARRLDRIVDDVLDIARVQNDGPRGRAALISLDASVATTCQEWLDQAPLKRHLQLHLKAGNTQVSFDPDHLRRILVNLLDNAQRYMGPHPDALQVSTRIGRQGQASLQVWSDAPALEHGVQKHLFEPFFSSESRSSGLGLYICRQLCERQGATIGYQRSQAHTHRGIIEGNAFFVRFPLPAAPAALMPAPPNPNTP